MDSRRIRVRRALCAAALTLVAIATACPVSNPEPGQTVPPDLVLDQVPDAVDVAYGPNPVQKLDVYLPDGPKSGIAILYLHSGGWCCGDKADVRLQGIPVYLMKQGHVVLSANYTLTPASGASPLPDNINDVKRAIGWASQPSVKAFLGYSKVVVAGGSAGGHLAALATTSGSVHPNDVPADWNVRPDAGMEFSGPLDMTTWGAQGTPAEQAAQLFFFHGFWGTAFNSPNEIPLLAQIAASPAAFVDPSDPPIYLGS